MDVGLLLTQLVRALGAHVITTVSTPEKAELSGRRPRRRL